MNERRTPKKSWPAKRTIFPTVYARYLDYDVQCPLHVKWESYPENPEDVLGDLGDMVGAWRLGNPVGLGGHGRVGNRGTGEEQDRLEVGEPRNSRSSTTMRTRGTRARGIW